MAEGLFIGSFERSGVRDHFGPSKRYGASAILALDVSYRFITIARNDGMEHHRL